MSRYSVAEVWTRFEEELLFLLLRLTGLTTVLILTANRKATWNKVKIS